MKSLGRDRQMPYYLYCDTSAFMYIDKYHDGPHKGKPRPQDGKARSCSDSYCVFIGLRETLEHFFMAKRAPPGKTINWWASGSANPCFDEQGRERDAFSHEGHNILVLCPSAWESPSSLLCEEDVVQEQGKSIDHMRTVGFILYHELTHLQLGSKRSSIFYHIS